MYRPRSPKVLYIWIKTEYQVSDATDLSLVLVLATLAVIQTAHLFTYL